MAPILNAFGGGARKEIRRRDAGKPAAKPVKKMVDGGVMVRGLLVFIVVMRVARTNAALCELVRRRSWGRWIYKSPEPRKFFFKWSKCAHDGRSKRNHGWRTLADPHTKPIGLNESRLEPRY